MGLITDIFFGLGDMFQWTFRNLLVPIGHVADWILFIVGSVLLVWWCIKLASFGNDRETEKDYSGW